MPSMETRRRLPIGAEVVAEGGAHFRVWSPRRRAVEVVLEKKGRREPEGGPKVLEPEGNGYFSGRVPSASAGKLYRFRLDGTDELYPDPASRFQPQGPHGPSQVIDPSIFPWTDGAWRGVTVKGQVIYEMHIGAFTKHGTWAAAAQELAELADAGITVLEVMPVADFPGKFGWGYDGVNLFAPTRLYGEPDDMRRFVDRAHALGLGVILDVVYNHVGPDGNYLKQFSENYFTDRYPNEWGEAINFDGDHSGPVREFFSANAGYWIDEFHLDGLRLDATQQIFDRSEDHILAAINRQVRQAARSRSTFLVAENEKQQVQLMRPVEQGGYGLDAQWNDDFHHSAQVALTGRNAAYYLDYHGTPQEFIAALKWGFLYQGQWYSWQKQRRGTPTLDQQPWRFITFIENHDQVANSGRGRRRHQVASPGRHRALTALLLLAPQTPMLFMGQEFSASSPFLFFADHNPELARLVRKGRGEFLHQFPHLATPGMSGSLADPADPATFERSKLDLGERQRHVAAYALHRDLIKLRREDAVFCAPQPHGLDGAVLGAEAFVIRFFGDDGNDRLMLINLGRDLHLAQAPEPLLAPPEGRHWSMLWSSEDPRYGGEGTAALETEENWRLPGWAAVVMRPLPIEEEVHG